MVVYLIIVACGVIGLARSVMIMLGVYKDPILHSLEDYGTDKRYSPLVELVVWVGVSLIIFLFGIADTSIILIGCVMLTIPATMIYPRMDGYIQRYPHVFLFYPSWYNRLLRTTSREEQRRIAYMWLRLPFRTRILYSTHDAFFHQWTDLVLLSMV
jgi:hypothetical protein